MKQSLDQGSISACISLVLKDIPHVCVLYQGKRRAAEYARVRGGVQLSIWRQIESREEMPALVKDSIVLQPCDVRCITPAMLLYRKLAVP